MSCLSSSIPLNSNVVFKSLLLVFLLQLVQVTWTDSIVEMSGNAQEDTVTPQTRLVTNLNLTFSGDYQRAIVHSHDKVVVCYAASWSFYRTPTEEASFDIHHIEPQLCTHLIYSFAKLNPQTFRMEPFDEWLDLKKKEGGGHDWYNRFVGFKKTYPHLKVLLAVGGWEEGAKKYSDMAASPARRQAFATSALELMRQYGFDGLDLDWEYPGHSERGGVPEDKNNFTLLVQELRQLLDKYGLMLTSAFGAAPRTAKAGYDLREVSKYLDHIHLMCYDYHGTWDGKTGHNAPLRAAPGQESIEDSVDYYLEQGVPANKLVMGVPFYGRTFLLKNDQSDGLASRGRSLGESLEDENGLGQPAEPKGFQGPLSKQDGFLGYNEIVKIILGNRSEWKIYWDDKAEVPFMRNGNKWVSFDNPDSIRQKMKFAMSKGLKGTLIWSIDTDDFHGYSKPNKAGVKNTLLRTINYSLHQINRDIQSSTTSKPRPRPPVHAGATKQSSKLSSGLLLALLSIFVIIYPVIQN